MSATLGRPEGRHHQHGAAQRRTAATPSRREGVGGRETPGARLGRPEGRHHPHGAAQRRTAVTPPSWKGGAGRVVP